MKKKEVMNEAAVETVDEVMPQESKGKKIANIIVNVILVAAIILAAVCTYVSFVSTSGNGVPSIFGIRMFIRDRRILFFSSVSPGVSRFLY